MDLITNYDEYMQDRPNGDPKKAEKYAQVAGAISTVMESLGMFTMFKGASHGLSAMTKAGVRKLLKSPTFMKAVTDFAKSVGISSFGEGLTEFMQELSSHIGGVLNKHDQDGTLKDLSTAKFLGQVIEGEA